MVRWWLQLLDKILIMEWLVVPEEYSEVVVTAAGMARYIVVIGMLQEWGGGSYG